MEQNDLRYLVKLAGKILFVTGLILSILMMLSGFWPGIFLVLMMLVGGGMVTFNKAQFRMPRLGRLRSLVSISAVALVLKRIVTVFLVLVVAGLLFLWLSQDYFKKRDTRNDGRDITKALQHYYDHKHIYPGSLSEIINQYPLRQGWRKDHWGNAYSYTTVSDSRSFTLISPGKDRKLNTGDDIVFGQMP